VALTVQADGAEAAAPMDATAGAGAATQKVAKKRVKKHSVPFSAETAAMSKEALQDLYAQECDMALQVRQPRPPCACFGVAWVRVRGGAGLGFRGEAAMPHGAAGAAGQAFGGALGLRWWWRGCGYYSVCSVPCMGVRG
jgi:hypothetical protein